MTGFAGFLCSFPAEASVVLDLIRGLTTGLLGLITGFAGAFFPASCRVVSILGFTTGFPGFTTGLGTEGIAGFTAFFPISGRPVFG